MKKVLMLDLIDKTPDKYIIKFSTIDGSNTGAILLPEKIYSWYKTAPVYGTTSYECETKYGNSKIRITKYPQFKYNDKYYMKINFMDFSMTIPDNKFIKLTKSYCFQSFIDIRILNGNGQVIESNYRFLKNYDTRSKAIYFIDKFANKFCDINKKWFLFDEVTFNIADKAMELFGGDLLYEHRYSFRCKDNNNIAVYTFIIISIEKG